MSMTWEEKIKVLTDLRPGCGPKSLYTTAEKCAALDLALTALRGPVSREQVEKMFPGCPYCDVAKANSNIYNKALWVKEAETRKWTLAGKSLQYCPICGRPLTDEAVEMMMERMEALHENIYNG